MRETPSRPIVTCVPFPCWGLSFDSPAEDPRALATTLIEWRNDERWLLLGGPAAISDVQLWTAWLGLGSRVGHDKMRANAIGAEFIRLIAGTHQIRIGFERAGIAKGDETAWLIHLPPFREGDISDADWPVLDQVALDAEADRLMQALGATLSAQRPGPTEQSTSRLEWAVDEDDIERAALAAIALADLS